MCTTAAGFIRLLVVGEKRLSSRAQAPFCAMKCDLVFSKTTKTKNAVINSLG